MALYQQALQPQQPQYVDAHGHPVYVQPQATPVVQFSSSPDQNIPPIGAQPQPYPQVYVPAVAANPVDDNLGADQSGLGRFVLRHQGTSRKNALGQAKVHQQKTWLAGYGRIAELAEAYFFLAIELFKICMACLLAVFVPQGCPPAENAILYDFKSNITIPINYMNTLALAATNGSINIGNGRLDNGQSIIGNGIVQNNQFINNGNITYNNITVAAPDLNKHECSLKENFIELTDLNIAALIFNFIALFVCIFHYWLLLRRERFFIDHFDADPKKNRINLRFQVTAFPKIESRMYRLNLLMFWTSILCIIILVINVILSAILVFRDYYLSERTVTVFITNCLLLGTTMTRTAESAFLGAHNNLALSSIDYEPVSYNVVDELYIKAKYGDEPNKHVEMAGLSHAPDSAGR